MVGATGKAIAFEELRSALREILQPFDHERLEREIASPATAETLASVIQMRLRHRLNNLAIQIRVQVGDDGWVQTE